MKSTTLNLRWQLSVCIFSTKDCPKHAQLFLHTRMVYSQVEMGNLTWMQMYNKVKENEVFSLIVVSGLCDFDQIDRFCFLMFADGDHMRRAMKG